MNKRKKDRLAQAGWQETTVQEFLGLTPEDMQYVELGLHNYPRVPFLRLRPRQDKRE